MTPSGTATASLSDVGSVRSVNQDRCADWADDLGYHLLLVADGMGGHQGGEVAAQTVIDTVGDVFAQGIEDPPGLLRNAFVIALGFTPLFFAPLVPYVTVGAFMTAIMTVSAGATLLLLPAVMRTFGKLALPSSVAGRLQPPASAPVGGRP